MKSFIHIVFAAALSLLFAVLAMAAEKVNINTADAAALDRVLVGVGPALAQEPPCPFYENRSGLCGYYHSEISPARA